MHRLRHILTVLPAWVLTACVFVAVAYLTLWPDPVPDADRMHLFPGADKVVHFIMWGALTGAAVVDYGRRQRSGGVSFRAMCAIVLVSTALGAVDEWAQQAMQMGRAADVYDFLSDALGAVVGAPVARALFRRVFNVC